MQERLLAIIQASPDFIAIKSGDGKWEVCNEAGLKIYGLQDVPYQGRTNQELALLTLPEYSDSLAYCTESDNQAWLAKTPSRTMETAPDNMGGRFYFDVVKIPMFHPDGSRKALVVFGRNVTEIMRGRSAEQFSDQLFQHTNEAVIVTNPDAKIIRVNPKFTEITGYSEEEVIGKNPRVLSSGRHDADFYNAMWQQILLEGHWHGEVWDRRKNGEIYPKWLSISAVHDDSGTVTQYIGAFTDVTEQKATIEKINFLAHHDPLTKLPNRVLLKDRFEHSAALSKRNNQHMAMLFLDLDQFKSVNDSLGHVVGDKLLTAVAQKLKTLVRDSDTLSRIGGDEFIILLPDIETGNAAQLMAEKILSELSKPLLVDAHEFHTSCSIGISMFPDEGEDFDTILKKSDTAMYHAKDGGRNAYRFFTTQMNVEAMERHHMQTYLRNALTESEFELHFQPQVDLKTGGLVGAEALIRWNSPVLGQVSPVRFIPAAEENGLILSIGNWVIEEACRQIQRWEEEGRQSLVISLNISAVQFTRGKLLETLLAAVHKYRVDPALIELELTESILLRDTHRAIQKMNEIKSHGFKLSIDDFGTGYSSLAYLKYFPVDKLKIDQAFVRNLNVDKSDAAIVRSIIHLGQSLGLRVIAEGVETNHQLKSLAELDCDEIQGYLIGRPTPSHAFPFDLSPQKFGLSSFS